MKKFIANTTCPTHFPIVSLLAIILFSFSVFAQVTTPLRFTELDRTISRGTLKQFKKQCSYIGTINDAKILEIQNVFKQGQKDLSKEQVDCYDQYLGQIVGSHNIYKSMCEEITPQDERFADKDLARLFVNVRKFEAGIRPYHEKLNDCLLRRSAPDNQLVDYSDFEKNSRALSKKIRDTSTEPPFRDNRVEFR